MKLPAAVRRALRLPGDAARWYRIGRTRPAAAGIHVYYGVERLPGRADDAHGGTIKLQALAETFPNSPLEFNVVYLGSSTIPEDASMLARLARRRGAPVVWNQNGVAYAGWHGPGWEPLNRRPALLLKAADHVVYQSEFCKLSADRFYGEREGPWEILYNPVDTARFTPSAREPRPLTLLLGGTQNQRYRFASAVETVRVAVRERPDARLIVAGRVAWHPDRRVAEREAAEILRRSGVADRVELVGTYSQAEAPALFRRADVLLHTQYNDACPTVVLEAMASGLPVVYSASGGVPELVGPDAGLGIAAPLDWEQSHPPDPAELANAVLGVAERLDNLSAVARERALRFDLRPWVDRHRQIFEELVR